MVISVVESNEYICCLEGNDNEIYKEKPSENPG